MQHWNMERLTGDGRTVRATTRLGTSWGTLRSFPFDIDVLVNPADEEQFVPASGWRSGAGGFAMLFGGLVLIAFGVVVLPMILG